jgi:hypothetical protein
MTEAELEPITLLEARRFVTEHHRHNVAPRGWLFGIGLRKSGVLVGVGIASRPVARALDDGFTVEVSRVTVLEGINNACSRLYGAICRAAKALGYRRAVTYTLASEPGSSVMAAGFHREAELPARSGWDNRPLNTPSLFDDNDRLTNVAKIRWVRFLAALEAKHD